MTRVLTGIQIRLDPPDIEAMTLEVQEVFVERENPNPIDGFGKGTRPSFSIEQLSPSLYLARRWRLPVCQRGLR